MEEEKGLDKVKTEMKTPVFTHAILVPNSALHQLTRAMAWDPML